MLTTSRLIRPAASAVASATARSVRFQATAAAAVGTQKKKNVLLSSKDSAAQLSYARGLFFGEVNAYQAFPYPDTLDDETRETIKALVEPVDKFFREKVNSAEIDKTSTIPKEVLDGLKEMGLFGLQIPTELDGLGLSNTAYARVVVLTLFLFSPYLFFFFFSHLFFFSFPIGTCVLGRQHCRDPPGPSVNWSQGHPPQR